MLITLLNRVTIRALWPVLISAAVQLWQPAFADAQPAPQHLDPQAPFSQYQHDAWTSGDGLPQNTVGAVVQSHDGYLWIATQDGLARFDGVRFTIFDKTTTPQLSHNDITALLVDGRGVLWIGTAGGGLVRHERGQFDRYTLEHGLGSNTITGLAASADGTVWIGTRNGGLSRHANGKFSSLTVADGLLSDDITTLTTDRDGNVWIGTREGLVLMAQGRLTSYNVAGAGTSGDVRSLVAASDGTLWIGTTRGLAYLRDGRVRAYSASGLGQDFIATLLEDGAGTLWAGTRGGGLVRVSGARVSRMRVADGLSEDDVVSLFEDSHGSLWIGCNTGGLNRLRRSSVTSYGTPEGLTHDIALPIVADHAGSVWVGTYGGGVNRFQGGRWSAYTTRDGLSGNQILALHPGRDGGLWIGTRTGLDKFANGVLSSYGVQAGVADKPVLALHETPTGELWVGTQSGLNRLARGELRTFTTRDGLGSDYVSVIHADRHGVLWVGTEGGGLSRSRGDRFEAYSAKDGFSAEIVWAIHEDAEGSLWFGTNGSGLIRLKDGRFTTYTTKHGLFNDSMFQILEDDQGLLWMSSQRGLSRVRKSDFADLDAGRLARVTAISYGEADGMRSAEFNGAIQPAGWKTTDGRLWFPTIKGVVVINPASMIETSPPRVLIEDATIDGAVLDPRQAADVRPGARVFQFRYTALGAANPSRTQFRYRLEGLDEDWVYAGTTRTARYTQIPAGDYRLVVEAASEPEAWSPEPASFALSVAPYFYQTFGFYFLALFGVALLAGSMYTIRVRALHSRHQEIMALADSRAQALEQNQRLLTDVDRQRARFEMLLATVPGIVWEATRKIGDPDYRITFVNSHVEDMLGYSAREFLGASDAWLPLIHPDDRERVLKTAASQFAAGSGVQQFRLIAKDGRAVRVEARGSVIRNADGVPGGIRGVTMDVSDQHRLEEQLRQSQKMEAVGRLAGGIAHDFNNLLTAIIGNAELLADDLGASQPLVNEGLEEIRLAADRAAGLTRQLLAFSRQQVLEPTILDLREVVETTASLLRRLIGEDVELVTNAGDATSRVLADRGQIDQVLMNLAVNARDAMPMGGTLTIDVTTKLVVDTYASEHPEMPPGRYVAVTVSDTGHGMDADTRAQIFEPFFTTKPVGIGTGLGLATVYGIVTQSGGHIVVDSEPGRGTTFTVLLPQAEAAPPAHPELPAPSAALPGAETILVIEDESGVRMLIHRVLTRAGYNIVEASNGAAALDLAARHVGSIDLILTDCVMPGVSGPVLAEQLTRVRPAAKVLFMSGHTDHAALRAGLLRSGAMFLQKPFTATRLAAVIRRVLDGAPVEM